MEQTKNERRNYFTSRRQYPLYLVLAAIVLPAAFLGTSLGVLYAILLSGVLILGYGVLELRRHKKNPEGTNLSDSMILIAIGACLMVTVLFPTRGASEVFTNTSGCVLKNQAGCEQAVNGEPERMELLSGSLQTDPWGVAETDAGSAR